MFFSIVIFHPDRHTETDRIAACLLSAVYVHDDDDDSIYTQKERERKNSACDKIVCMCVRAEGKGVRDHQTLYYTIT